MQIWMCLGKVSITLLKRKCCLFFLWQILSSIDDGINCIKEWEMDIFCDSEWGLFFFLLQIRWWAIWDLYTWELSVVRVSCIWQSCSSHSIHLGIRFFLQNIKPGGKRRPKFCPPLRKIVIFSKYPWWSETCTTQYFSSSSSRKIWKGWNKYISRNFPQTLKSVFESMGYQLVKYQNQ